MSILRKFVSILFSRTFRKLILHKLCIFFLLLSLMMAPASSCGKASGPEDTAALFLESVRKGNIHKALRCFLPGERDQLKAALYSSAELLKAEPEELIGGLLGLPCPGFGTEQNFRILDVIITGDAQAEAHIEVVSGNRGPEEFLIKLVRSSGRWYLSE